jgi:hypothetical protein
MTRPRVPDREELAVAVAQVALEPHLVFPVLVDLDRAPSWCSIQIARLAVPDGALHEGDRFPATVALAEWHVELRCQVVTLERPVEVGYEVVADDELVLRLVQHVTPVPGGSELRWSCAAVDERLDPVLVRHHLHRSLQRFRRMLEPGDLA